MYSNVLIHVCIYRGGGELGVEWHNAGKQMNKRQSADDLKACIDHIHKRFSVNNSNTKVCIYIYLSLSDLIVLICLCVYVYMCLSR